MVGWARLPLGDSEQQHLDPSSSHSKAHVADSGPAAALCSNTFQRHCPLDGRHHPGNSAPCSAPACRLQRANATLTTLQRPCSGALGVGLACWCCRSGCRGAVRVGGALWRWHVGAAAGCHCRYRGCRCRAV